ncbi:hypothetical protein GEMRC1_005949 [Eukaryota sp. GEM-RC1]
MSAIPEPSLRRPRVASSTDDNRVLNLYDTSSEHSDPSPPIPSVLSPSGRKFQANVHQHFGNLPNGRVQCLECVKEKTVSYNL